MLQATLRSRSSLWRRTNQRWPLLSDALACLCIQGLLASLILALGMLAEPEPARPGDSGGFVAVAPAAGHRPL